MPNNLVIKEAIKIAKSSKEDFRLGAVLFRGGSIINASSNSYKILSYRRPLFEYEATRHAECAVIHNIPKEVLKECGMIVIRIDRKNNIVSAKPCKACIQAIKSAGISKLFYSSYNGDLIKINPNKIDVDNWDKESILDD